MAGRPRGVSRDERKDEVQALIWAIWIDKFGTVASTDWVRPALCPSSVSAARPRLSATALMRPATSALALSKVRESLVILHRASRV